MKYFQAYFTLTIFASKMPPVDRYTAGLVILYYLSSVSAVPVTPDAVHDHEKRQLAGLTGALPIGSTNGINTGIVKGGPISGLSGSALPLAGAPLPAGPAVPNVGVLTAPVTGLVGIGSQAIPGLVGGLSAGLANVGPGLSGQSPAGPLQGIQQGVVNGVSSLLPGLVGELQSIIKVIAALVPANLLGPTISNVLQSIPGYIPGLLQTPGPVLSNLPVANGLTSALPTGGLGGLGVVTGVLGSVPGAGSLPLPVPGVASPATGLTGGVPAALGTVPGLDSLPIPALPAAPVAGMTDNLPLDVLGDLPTTPPLPDLARFKG
ncbi:hypothetical protein BT63DRAFT_102253 [Microthyrium microscopicum]|uniref:Uncharacterized protein n=1 Tax=Microthyrium microscopicum TaxID=703497 RepID=A0A6A6TYB4_9PEZI|nr:hypothetical protein BT63DRAFT_102253 [Microthyrium microscopicum]